MFLKFSFSWLTDGNSLVTTGLIYTRGNKLEIKENSEKLKHKCYNPI